MIVKDNQIKVKIAYNGDIMVTYIDPFMDFDSLSRQMDEICRFTDHNKLFTMKWIDDEGDPCMLTTQKELDEALRLYEYNQESDFTILVFPGIPETPGSLCPGEDKNMFRRGAKRWRKLYHINGHLFQLKRFSRKAICVLCDERIWGLGSQGLKCINCKLLIHKRCHKNVTVTCVVDNTAAVKLPTDSGLIDSFNSCYPADGINRPEHKHTSPGVVVGGAGKISSGVLSKLNETDIIIENRAADFLFSNNQANHMSSPFSKRTNDDLSQEHFFKDSNSDIIDSYEYMRAIRHTPTCLTSNQSYDSNTSNLNSSQLKSDPAFDTSKTLTNTFEFRTTTMASLPPPVTKYQQHVYNNKMPASPKPKKVLKDITQAFPIIPTSSSSHAAASSKKAALHKKKYSVVASPSPAHVLMKDNNMNIPPTLNQSSLPHKPFKSTENILSNTQPKGYQQMFHGESKVEEDRTNFIATKKMSGGPNLKFLETTEQREVVKKRTLPIPPKSGVSSIIPKKSRYQLSDFELIKVIGRGSYAKVFLTELKESKKIFAMKVIKKELINDEEDVDWVQTEKHVFETATHHPFLVGLHSCFQTPTRLIFVIEFVNGGDLMFHMQRQRRLPEDHARFYSAEIICALNFLHRKGIIYRDLKLDNVLLDSEGHIRLTDYGMCKEGLSVYDKTSTFCGTPNYIAPEILRGDDYGFSVDWWALGVLMFEMLAGRSPFDIVGASTDNPDHNTEDYLFQVILEKTIRIPRSISVKSASVLKGFLNKDPRERLGCHPDTGFQDIVNHCFFKSIDWEMLESKQLTPPFKPKLTNDRAVDNFDPQFTNEPAILTPDEPSVLERLHQTEFEGFEYVNPLLT